MNDTKNSFYKLIIYYTKVLSKIPQPIGGLILITTLAFVFLLLPLIVLDNLGVLPKGGAYNEEQRCDYYGTNC